MDLVLGWFGAIYLISHRVAKMWKIRALHVVFLLLIILLCTDKIAAATHGPFGQKVRDAQRLSGHAVPQQAPLNFPQEDFRFLNQETQRAPARFF